MTALRDGTCDWCERETQVRAYDDGHAYYAICDPCEAGAKEAWDAMTPEEKAATLPEVDGHHGAE